MRSEDGDASYRTDGGAKEFRGKASTLCYVLSEYDEVTDEAMTIRYMGCWSNTHIFFKRNDDTASWLVLKSGG